MAYQAKRRRRLEETLELCDADGKVDKVIRVSLDADDMLVKINRKYTDLTRTLAETTEMKRQAQSGEVDAECLDKLGRAVLDLFEAVFGKTETNAIAAFYENRYVEMVYEVVPFITSVVIPRCIEIRKENQKNLLRSYDRPAGIRFLNGNR